MQMMKGGLIMDKIKILKALSDNTRLSILNLLNGEKLCVCEIEAILDNTQSNISRHLAKLKEADLILSTKYAQWVHYELNYELLQKHQFIKILLEEIKDDDYYRTQIEKIEKYKIEDSKCNDKVSK